MSRRRERAANARHRRRRAPAGAPHHTPSAIAPGTDIAPAGATYLPGLDGLRALAVIAVVIFHARTDWLPGGFLGVDVFFVVSGFIITRGLLSEWDARRRIDAPAFWVRRGRRLLPALVLVLAGALGYCAFADTDRVSQLRADSLASLFYATNWYLIHGDQSYFAALAPPSLLRHLWSLAVEEQFYLFWPFALSAGLAIFGRRRVVVAIAFLAVASALDMSLLYHAGASTSRLYYGTDTHLAGLLGGAAMAVPLTGNRRFGARASAGKLLDVLAVAAAALLLYLTLAVDDQGALLYNGGFAAVAVASGVLMVAAIHPATLLSRVLERAPLRWIGRRSYGIYLWHWPIFVLMAPADPASAQGMAILAAEACAAVAIAAVSYRFIEEPIRHGGLRRALRSIAAWPRRTRVATATAFAGGLASLAVALIFLVRIPAPETPPYFATSHVLLVRDSAADAVEEPSATPTTSVPVLLQHSAALLPQDGIDPFAVDFAARPTTPAAIPTPAAAPLRGGASVPAVTAIGDSVMLGAAHQLVAAAPHVTVDAAVGRSVSTALDVMRQAAGARTLGSIVVLDIGNNGTFTDAEFNEAMRIAGDSRRVVFVNLKEPRAWEAPNNVVIARGVSRYPNAELADWHSASASRPELFYGDLIHLRPEGAAVYVALIASHFH